MIVNCPQCGKQLRLGEKILESMNRLEPGRKVKLKCIGCGGAFAIDAGSVIGASPGKAPGAGKAAGITPPGPPDVSWLKDGTFDDKDVVEDIPRALVLMPGIPSKDVVVNACSEFGYLVEEAADPDEAVEKMRFVNYAAVFLHTKYEPGGVRSGGFAEFMRKMAMSRRRYIFYVLIGEQFRTLYDLQALAYSANLVINEEDAPYVGTILRKAIPEYEALFAPLMEELRIAGKM
jgi:hypothetical protein